MKLSENEKILLFGKYYEALKSGVYNYAVKMLSDKETASDVMQNVFVKFFEHIENIREEEKIKVWIFKSARNEIYGIYRKSGNSIFSKLDKTAIENISVGGFPHEKVEAAELANILLDEVNKLSETSREVILLREYAFLSYNEIAEITGVEINVVKSRLHKARKKLIDKISKLYR